MNFVLLNSHCDPASYKYKKLRTHRNRLRGSTITVRAFEILLRNDYIACDWIWGGIHTSMISQILNHAHRDPTMRLSAPPDVRSDVVAVYTTLTATLVMI
jgi:hypothetical protein